MSHQASARTLAFQPGERNIFFHILTACNLSCRHCYINRGQHGTDTLPPQTISRWLRLFHREDRPGNLIFLGGEPTLHPDLPAAVRKARDIGYASVTIDTNGFLHNDILSKISPREAVLSFSLDGPDAATNDPIRGQGVFATCTANLRRAAAAGFEVSLIYTVSAMNIDALARMPELLADLGVRHFFIQIIGLRGSSQATADPLQVSREQWLAKVPPVAEAAAAKGLHVIFPKVFLDPGEPFQCAAKVAENFFIFPNGRVYQCPLCEDFPIHSLEIKENSLRHRPGLTEERFFSLDIPEGCVMNKLLQPGNISYGADGLPRHRVACCLLKQEFLIDS